MAEPIRKSDLIKMVNEGVEKYLHGLASKMRKNKPQVKDSLNESLYMVEATQQNFVSGALFKAIGNVVMKCNPDDIPTLIDVLQREIKILELVYKNEMERRKSK